MCGIIGYSGSKKTLPKLIAGLYALEYRGYDSAGVAFFKDNDLNVIKSKGRIDFLKEKLDLELDSNCGIGHTRWATHGEPSDINSHPHGTDNLYIVHNGIIENYAEIKLQLIQKGYVFVSETDTEVAAKLIDFYYCQTNEPVSAIRKAINDFRGSFAIAIIFKDYENTIFGTRRDNPMLIAPANDGNYITSDISAVLSYTKDFYRPEEGDIVTVTSKDIKFIDKNDNEIIRTLEKAVWNREQAEKGGFPFFMIKEINEEPDSIRRTLTPRINNGLPSFDSPLLSAEKIKTYDTINIVACGTAYHAGLIAKFAIEKLARIRVDVHLASEFRYNNPILSKNDLVIVISQSGETADSLAALRLSKERGVPVLGVVNVAGSAIAREADDVIYTLCGPEIAVASTKAYSVQIALLYLISVHMAYTIEKIDESVAKQLTSELVENIHLLIQKVIDSSETFSEVADEFKDAHSIFFIGRGIDHYLCCEAALKCKEISYIHCESYAAGELKHGTISLITEGTPVIAIMSSEEMKEKMISNIREVKARGANILLIVRDGIKIPDGIVDNIILIPNSSELLFPLVGATAIQLLAYYLSFNLGIDVDKPRNLAKSVTVE